METISNTTLKGCWNKLHNEIPENIEVDTELTTFVKSIEGYENITDKEVEEWMIGDEEQKLVDKETEFINKHEEEEYSDEDPEAIREKNISPEGFHA